MRGIVINALMLVYLSLGATAVFHDSLFFGLLYLGVIVLGFVSVAYTWCSRCPRRRDGCTHIWLGRLAEVLPERDPGSFGPIDWLGTTVYIGGLHLFPQYWLWQNRVTFVLFWVLVGATYLIGTLGECADCENRTCPQRRRAGWRVDFMAW